MMKKLILFSLLLSSITAYTQVSISPSGSSPDPSAGLDVNFNNLGFLPPRLTTAQRDAISSPARGLRIYNLDTDCENFYNGSAWKELCGDCFPQPPVADAGADQLSLNIPDTTTTLTGNNPGAGSSGQWTIISGSGGSFSDDSDPASNFTGLAGGSYTLQWTISNACASTSDEVQISFLVPCGAINVTFTYRGAQVTYGTAPGQSNTCWLDRNLGASQVATSYNDAAAYGDLFQWGRLDDGHQDRTSGTTTTLSTSDIPGHANFILSSSTWDWRNPGNDNLWQGDGGINDPCPAGWRVPTIAEATAEVNSWSPQDYTGAYASFLKWTAAGWRHYGNGSLAGVGAAGEYWSSDIQASNTVQTFGASSSGIILSSAQRSRGKPVRCIQD